MNLEKTIKISIIFLLGFLSANLIGLYLVYGLEMPVSLNGLSFTSNDNSVPYNFVDEDQIIIYEDKIIIDIEGASMGRYAPTGSMKPLLDENSNGIRIVPKSEENIHIGDIISFKEGDYLVVHRVVDKGIDKQGVYFITKGDNNNINDGKVRFENIKYVTIGVIW